MHHASGDAVSQRGLTGFAGRHAGRRAEHLARQGEPLTQTPPCMRLVYGDPHTPGAVGSPGSVYTNGAWNALRHAPSAVTLVSRTA
jgi:hypothetical protein